MKKEIIFSLSYLLFFFSPIAVVMTATGVLVLSDMITGVRAAQKRKDEITSKKLARTVSKIIFYFIAITLSHLMELVFFPVIPIAAITSGYIGLVEFKSNMENISSITGVNVWDEIIDKIYSIKK